MLDLCYWIKAKIALASHKGNKRVLHQLKQIKILGKIILFSNIDLQACKLCGFNPGKPDNTSLAAALTTDYT